MHEISGDDRVAKNSDSTRGRIAELIHWGDIIDGAQFESPEAAVGLREPAMQLALVIEAAPEPDLVPN